MHYTTKQEAANSEREGYVVDPLSADSVQLEQPNINVDDVRFSASALVDVNVTNVSSDEINYHLKKIYANDNNIPIEDEISQMNAASMNEPEISITDVPRNEEKVYMIPRSSEPTNEYSNPNLLLVQQQQILSVIGVTAKLSQGSGVDPILWTGTEFTRSTLAGNFRLYKDASGIFGIWVPNSPAFYSDGIPPNISAPDKLSGQMTGGSHWDRT
ncbi:unnamed protein product, partial [Didymodactylos carnosus]